MQAEIDRLSNAGVPRSLTEISTPGRTLKRRSRDILAYFDHPHTSNRPTEAINGRLEHLRGSALGYRNPTTTSPEDSSKQEESAPNYTPNYEEPHWTCRSLPDGRCRNLHHRKTSTPTRPRHAQRRPQHLHPQLSRACKRGGRPWFPTGGPHASSGCESNFGRRKYFLDVLKICHGI